MNTTATWYRLGAQVQSGSSYIGCVGYDGGAVVGRFAFTTGNAGASALSFQSAELKPAGSTTWASGGTDSFRFRIGTDPEAYLSQCGSDGNTTGVFWGEPNRMDSDGSLSVQLMPNTQYYLWIYPASDSYNLWRITGVTVTLTGSYGSPAGITASGGYFGEGVSITLSGGSAGASYTVTASCAGRTETLQTKGTRTALNWTPAVSNFAPLLPNASSAAATITVQTWYGSNLAGSASTSATLRFRAVDLRPAVSGGWYSHSPYNTGNAASIALYIQGISRAEISFDAAKISTRYGASIAGYTVSCGGSSVTESPYRTPVLSGESSVTVTVRDSRGFTASESFTITPLGYKAPYFSRVRAFRCDQNGTAAEDGRFLMVAAAGAYSALNGRNSAIIRRSLRPISGSFGGETSQQNGTTVILPGLDPDVSYELKLTITDALGGSSVVLRQIPGQKWAMKFRADGKGVAFGMAPQADKRLEIPSDWEIVRGEECYIPLTESGSSGIWRWKKWADGSFELIGSTSVTINVNRSWGALYYGVALSNVSFPFGAAAIDYAGAWIADLYCFTMGTLGNFLNHTGLVYALCAETRTNTTLPLRLLIRGRWK